MEKENEKELHEELGLGEDSELWETVVIDCEELDEEANWDEKELEKEGELGKVKDQEKEGELAMERGPEMEDQLEKVKSQDRDRALQSSDCIVPAAVLNAPHNFENPFPCLLPVARDTWMNQNKEVVVMTKGPKRKFDSRKRKAWIERLDEFDIYIPEFPCWKYDYQMWLVQIAAEEQVLGGDEGAAKDAGEGVGEGDGVGEVRFGQHHVGDSFPRERAGPGLEVLLFPEPGKIRFLHRFQGKLGVAEVKVGQTLGNWCGLVHADGKGGVVDGYFCTREWEVFGP